MFWKKKQEPSHPLWVTIPVVYNVLFVLLFIWAWITQPIPAAHEYLVAWPVIVFPFLDQLVPAILPIGDFIILAYLVVAIVLNALVGAGVVLLGQKMAK